MDKRAAELSLCPENDRLDALELASRHGDLRTVTQLLEAGIDLRFADEIDGQFRILLQAAKGGHLPILKKLVEAGFNINATDCEGDTPLIDAVRNGMSVAGLECLVEGGAEISAAQISLLMASGCGEYTHFPDILDKLLLAGSQDMRSAKLVVAIEQGRISVAEQLLGMGVAVNPTEEYDEEDMESATALIAAAKGGHLRLWRSFSGKAPQRVILAGMA